MRVLHVLDHSLPVQSGYSFRGHAILREQRKLGITTSQVTSSKHGRSSAGRETVGDMVFYRVNASSGWLAQQPLFNQLDVVRQLRTSLRQILDETGADVIHAHSPCLTAMAALDLGKPLIYELRSSWEDAAVSSGVTSEGSLRYRLSRWLETRVLKRSDHVTTICEGLREEAIKRGVAAERITVVPNAVDNEAFRPAAQKSDAARRQYGLEGCFVLGFIGSFFAWEGLPLLLEALPQVIARRPDIRVLLVGGGPDEPTVRATVERLKLQPHVTFAGQVKHDAVAAIYDAVDVLVYPRTPMRLTNMVTPLKPLEAMALAKVFIASDVGGHRELVRDRETGVLFRAGDREDLARTILEVANDAALRAKLERAGPEFIRSERTWAKVVARYVPVYESVLAKRRQ
jgi:PEP-CTERM/exosortase A-associated glycosyltransferase